ncbi:MAG: hypothetical protein LC754_06540 [Acidobacteria bacterium]|nr:hypothetical protein [Acidobacteriota bacterium]
MKSVKLAAVILLLSNVTTAQTASSSPTPTTAPDISLVKLNVLVTDDKGHFAGDAKQEDFHVFEDGVEQRITFFARDESPLSYGLVVDNSGSLRSMMNTVVSITKAFVKYNRAQDETFVVRFVGSDHISIMEDFTSNTAALSKAKTGGRAFAIKKVPELQDAFNDIMLHLRTQYVLGYTPPAKLESKTSRKVEVKMGKATGGDGSNRIAITRSVYMLNSGAENEKKKKK